MTSVSGWGRRRDAALPRFHEATPQPPTPAAAAEQRAVVRLRSSSARLPRAEWDARVNSPSRCRGLPSSTVTSSELITCAKAQFPSKVTFCGAEWTWWGAQFNRTQVEKGHSKPTMCTKIGRTRSHEPVAGVKPFVD